MGLIDLLEKATGPDRVHDADIATAIGNKVYQVKRRDGQGSWTRYEFRDGNEVPAYTSSIDAALSLVPEGATWDLTFDDYLMACVGSGHNTGKHDTTPAIALCIAALKARR